MEIKRVMYKDREVVVDERIKLAEIFQDHFKTGIGAEIGVLFGAYTKQILENGWRGSVLCVDCWKEEDQLKTAIDTLDRNRTIIVRAPSMEAVKLIKDNSLDWVYIDADHSYKGAREDIYGWYPKVRSGGIISGHDYVPWDSLDEQEKRDHSYVERNEVYKAVDEFCAERDYKFELLNGNVYFLGGRLNYTPNFASWWFEKR